MPEKSKAKKHRRKGLQATPEETSDETTQICESFSDPTADIQLVSAYGTIFRIHSFFLQARSSVFRDMIANIPKEPQPQLSPILIDTSDTVLKRFLQYLTDVPEDHFVSLNKQQYLDIIKLCDAFDTPSIRSSLCLELWDKLDYQETTGWDIFVLASRLQNQRLAEAAILEFDHAEMQWIQGGRWTIERLADPDPVYLKALMNAALGVGGVTASFDASRLLRLFDL